MTTTRTKPDETHHLLNLPAEIRSQILTECLASRLNRHAIDDGYSEYRFHFSVLRVNHQLYDEGCAVFRRENVFIHISTPWRQAEEHVAVEGRVPILAVGEKAASFTGVHLEAMVDVPEMRYQRENLNTFLVCLADLHDFCKMWFYSDLTHPGLNGHLRLSLGLKNPCPLPDDDLALHPALQRQLLMPFTQIKGLAAFQINGTVSSRVETDFKNAIAIPHDSAEECFDRCNVLKEAGSEELKRENYHAALKYYRKAFDAIHIIVAGRRRSVWADPLFDKIIETGIYKGQNGPGVRVKLRIQLVANIVHAYAKLENWAEAMFWGMRTINLMKEALGVVAEAPTQGFPAADSWGMIYYRTAVSAHNLGAAPEARELIDVAVKWLPKDKHVQEAQKAIHLNESVDSKVGMHDSRPTAYCHTA